MYKRMKLINNPRKARAMMWNYQEDDDYNNNTNKADNTRERTTQIHIVQISAFTWDGLTTVQLEIDERMR